MYLHELKRLKQIIGSVVLISGIILIAASIVVDIQLSPIIKKIGIIRFRELAELKDIILFTIFNAGFPLGAGITIVGAGILSDASRKRIWWYAWLIILAALIFSLIPRLSGGEDSLLFFSVGGTLIAILFLLFTWFWSRNRHKLDIKSQIAADLKMAGYLFFLLAAWRLCTIWGMPFYLIYPEDVIKFQTLPRIISQVKLIMVLIIIGWIFTVIGYNYNNRINIQIRKILKKTKFDEN